MAVNSSFKEQLLNRDDKYFRKYIENTTTHGVVRIFASKSYFRRILWLIIVLTVAAGCLHNIINRIIFFTGHPTSTTLSLTRQENLTFPAVTVCNLNLFRRDMIEAIHPGFSDILQNVFYSDSLDVNETRECSVSIDEFVQAANLQNLSIESLYFKTKDPFDEFVLGCSFSGQICNKNDFVLTLTDLGFCYTFNMQNKPFKAVSTGTRAGLFLALNIQQSQYVASTSFDAGVKVVVHSQSKLPRSADTGVAVPPGRNAFIGIQKRAIVDETHRECQPQSDTSDFNFLKDEIYSTSSCSYDCLLSNIAKQCQCNLIMTPTNNKKFEKLPACTVSDICCVLKKKRLTIDCQCLTPCNTTVYELFNSYSAFPSQHAANDLETLFILPDNSSLDTRENLLSLNVYFETLNIETQTTSNSYDFVALLSDIGGQMGLFMGMSVISVMEFVSWLVDEFSHRLFGNRLTEKILCRCCKRKKEVAEKPENTLSSVVIIEDKDLSTSTLQSDA